MEIIGCAPLWHANEHHLVGLKYFSKYELTCDACIQLMETDKAGLAALLSDILQARRLLLGSSSCVASIAVLLLLASTRSFRRSSLSPLRLLRFRLFLGRSVTTV